MIDLNKSMSYEEYIKGYTDEQAENQKVKYEQAVLSADTVSKVEELKSKVKILIFSEGYCPDCHVTIPFIMKMEELNKNIQVYFMNKIGNETLLNEFTGDARIPTVMFFTENMEPKGVYIEFPEALKDIMSGKSMDGVRQVVQEYRNGQYNKLIEKQIIDILSR
jgi:thiol-disulfide isomerase/thioredoxin